MNIVDSSVWIDYFLGGSNADRFSKPIEDSLHLLVPSIVLFEVFKKILKERGREVAEQYIVHLQLGHIVDLTPRRALSAANISVDLGLPMADSIIYAIALEYDAVIWTLDSDFESLDKVRYFPPQ